MTSQEKDHGRKQKAHQIALFFLLYRKGTWHFYLALNLANYVAGPIWSHSLGETTSVHSEIKITSKLKLNISVLYNSAVPFLWRSLTERHTYYLKMRWNHHRNTDSHGPKERTIQVPNKWWGQITSTRNNNLISQR